MIHLYDVHGMSCGSCAAKIEAALKALDGITAVSVARTPPVATVQMNRHISLETLNAAVKQAGKYSLTEHPAAASNPAPTLNPASAINEISSEENRPLLVVYYPLILIFLYLLGASLLGAANTGDFSMRALMTSFMGGFFIIFSFFKFLNLQGFAEAYSTYDIVASRFPAYGYVYPFIELLLGIMYLTGLYPSLTNVVTILVMGVSTVGVVKALRRKSKIQCACLGTVFNLPMTKVTFVEDTAMVLMALMMLLA